MNKNYISLITTSPVLGESPTLDVIQNTLGEIVWGNPDDGIIVGIGTGLFPENATTIELKYQSSNGIAPVTNGWGWSRNSDDQITIDTGGLNGQLTNHLLIITVYDRVINYSQ